MLGKDNEAGSLTGRAVAGWDMTRQRKKATMFTLNQNDQNSLSMLHHPKESAAKAGEGLGRLEMLGLT